MKVSNKPFDQYSDAYAHVFLHGAGNYAHMEMTIYNLIPDEWSRVVIKAACQIGISSPYPSDRIEVSQVEKPYAWEFGINHVSNSPIPFECLTSACNVMKKVDTKLRKAELTYGSPESFSDYLLRIIIASGVKVAFVNPSWGGGYGKLTELPCFLPLENVPFDTSTLQLFHSPKVKLLKDLESHLIEWSRKRHLAPKK